MGENNEKDFGIGSCHWLLAPFNIILNDFVLLYQEPKYLPIEDLKIGTIDIQKLESNSKYTDYHKYWCLCETPPKRGDCGTVPEIGNVINQFYGGQERKFDNFFDELRKIWEIPKFDNHLQSFMYYLPQSKDNSNLFGSKAWQDGNFNVSSNVPNWGKNFLQYIKNEITSNNNPNKDIIDNLRLFAEERLRQIYKQNPYVKWFYEIKKKTNAQIADKFNEVDPFFVCISFFEDAIPDLIMFMPLKKGSENGEKNVGNGSDVVKEKIALSLFGLSQSMLEHRNLWIHRWINRLCDRIISEFKYEEGVEDEKKGIDLAKTAITYMAAVFLFLEEKEKIEKLEEALVDGDETSDSKTKGNLKLNPTKIEEFIKNNNIHQSVYVPSSSRIEYIKKFIIHAVDAVNAVLDTRTKGKLKGNLSRDVTKDLHMIAQSNPIKSRVILLGSPGGGKSTAAKDFHIYSMMEIKKAPEKSKKFLEGVYSSVSSIFGLPIAVNLIDRGEVEQLYKFFFRQIEGTKWWEWELKEEEKELPFCIKHFNHPCPAKLKKIYSDNASGENGSCIFSKCNNSDKCPLKSIFPLMKKKSSLENLMLKNHKFGRNEILGLIHSLILGFCRKIMTTLIDDENFEFNFNFNQINCGTLGGNGEELIMSLRQLFGYIERGHFTEGKPGHQQFSSTEIAVPGLFQTCAYMGGTLFLDEIADAPVKIQDNLLLALEEGEVFRIGWETVKENVSNIRIVSATHKDLKAEVKKYRDTLYTSMPQGFRPDLLSRLAQSPPVNVRPITDYFIYGEDEVKIRETYKTDFINIMNSMTGKNIYPVLWGMIFDNIDLFIIEEIERRFKFSGMSSFESRKKLARQLTMRLFKTIADILKTDELPIQKRVEAYILDKYLPNMLRYLMPE